MPKGKGTSQFKKKCVKPTSYPCGFTCIARRNPSGSERICHNPLKKQAATFTLWLAEQEKRLAKVNAHRTAKGRATYSLNDSKLGLVKDKSSVPPKTTEKVSDAAIAPPQIDKLQASSLSKKAIKELVAKNISRSVFDSMIEHDVGNYEGGGGQFTVTLSTSKITKANLNKLAIALSPNKTKTSPPMIKSDGDIATITYRNADHQYSGAMDEMNGMSDRLKAMGINVSSVSDKKEMVAESKKAIASPSPEVKPVPSPLQGSEKAIASSNLIPYSANENGVIVKNYPDDLPGDDIKEYIAKGDRKNIYGDTLSPRSVPTHQMRFEDYKEAWKNWTGSPGYTDDGINKSDLYYKKAIDKAIAEGKTIHPDVMKDYNNLDLSDYNTRKPKRSPAYEKAEREGTLSRLRPVEKTAKETEKAIASLEDLAKLRVDNSPKIASGVLLGSERVSDDVGDRYGDGTNAGRYIEYRVRRMPIEEARKYGYTGSGNIALERRPYDDSTTGRYWEGEWQPVHFASNTKELLDQQRGMLGRLESDHPYIKTIKENDRRSKEDAKAKQDRDRQAAETARVNHKDWIQTHVNQQYANSLPGKKITLHLDLVGEDDSTPTAPVPATRYGNMAVHKKYRYMDKDGTVHLGSTYSISDPSTGVVVVPSIPTLDQARRLTAVLYHEISDKNPIEWTVDERKKAGNIVNAFLNSDRPSHITDNSTPVIREKKKARK